MKTLSSKTISRSYISHQGKLTRSRLNKATRSTFQLTAKSIALTNILVSAILLSGCGGSSDSSSSDDQTIPDNALPINTCETSSGLSLVSTSSELSFNVEKNYSAGQSATIVANVNNSNSAGLTYKWQQTSGATISLVSENSPVLSFVIPDSGDYSFSVNVSGNQTNLTETVSITANSAINQLNINSDHQVVAGNGVSLRVERINDQLVNDIQWCYFSNQSVELDLTNTERPLFTAPNVNADSIIGLKATGEFAW